MQRIYRLFVLLTLLGGYPVSLQAQDTLTVMTYNIYHGEFYYQRGESNLQAIAGLIRQVKPDLVALQEVDSMTQRSASFNSGTPLNQVKRLANLTGMHGYFGKAISYDGGGYGEGLLTKRPLEDRKIMLPIPEGGERRALLTVEYTLDNGEKLIFGGTHLCHQYEANRVAQVKKIRQYFEPVTRPFILAGDLNFTPEDRPYSLFRESPQWTDAAVLSGETAPTHSYQEPGKRIDYIFLSNGGWEILDYKILHVDHSDHMPVVLKVVTP